MDVSDILAWEVKEIFEIIKQASDKTHKKFSSKNYITIIYNFYVFLYRIQICNSCWVAACCIKNIKYKSLAARDIRKYRLKTIGVSRSCVRGVKKTFQE